MYTWGYIKDAALAYLDMNEVEAQNHGLLKRFPFYANTRAKKKFPRISVIAIKTQCAV